MRIPDFRAERVCGNFKDTASNRLRAAVRMELLPAQMPRYQVGDRPPGIGDWELEELLGVGGFGEVWRARNPHLADPVALKFCLDPKAAQWLRHEAALLGRVMAQGKHPGIVPLLDTYLNGDPPCIKYEYVAGGDLSGLIGDAQPLAVHSGEF